MYGGGRYGGGVAKAMFLLTVLINVAMDTVDAYVPMHNQRVLSPTLMRESRNLVKKSEDRCLSSAIWKRSCRGGISLSSEVISAGKGSSLSSGGRDDDHSNEFILDLSHYHDLRSFNLALENIAIECQGVMTTNSNQPGVDVIGRATVAEALFRKLEQEFSKDNVSFRPDLVSYNTLLKVWAKTAQTLAQGRGRGDVQAVFHAMDNVPEDLLSHIAGVGGVTTARDAALRASSILHDLESLYLRGETDIAPNEQTYNTVMDAWCKCGAKDSSKRTDEMFQKMMRWSSVGVEKSGNEEDELAYANGDVAKWEQIHPDAISYSICIESLGRDGKDGRIFDTISTLLQSLDKDYEMTQSPSLKPNVRVANSAILALSKIRSRPPLQGRDKQNAWIYADKANSIFNHWNQKYLDTGDEDYKPDATTFTALIETYSKVGERGAAEKAEDMFNSMLKEWTETGDIRLKPTSKTFAALVSAWARIYDTRSPAKVEKLLELMEELYANDVANGEKDSSSVKPYGRTYTSAINAWARSKDNTKPQRALRILKKVTAMYKESGDSGIKPSLFMYNAVIDACARCNGSPKQMNEALKIAFAVNKAITSAKMQPNHITYSTLIRATSKLMPPGPERNDVVKAVFEKAKKFGMVDKNVLKSFQVAADRDLFYELLSIPANQYGNVDFDDIPSDWSKNVHY